MIAAMPEIVFKGKEYVYNHHLTVPYRPLLVDKAKGIGPGDLESNLVIHGDNLHALKALLPRYAGQVGLGRRGRGQAGGPRVIRRPRWPPAALHCSNG